MRAIFVAVFVSAIYGCGGGGESGSPTDSTASTMPLEDDVDSNGVRDSVESAISEYTIDNDSGDAVLELAIKMQAMLNSNDSGSEAVNANFKSLVDSIECGQKNNEITHDDLMFVKLFTLDTEERQASYSSIYLQNIQLQNVELITEVEC